MTRLGPSSLMEAYACAAAYCLQQAYV